MLRTAGLYCLLTVPFLAADTGSAAAPADSSRVIAAIRTLEQTYGGHLGMMAKDLRTGQEIRYNASEKFPTASAVKLPVMVTYFQAVHDGRLRPGTRIPLPESEKKPGSGVLQFLTGGDSLTLSDAVTLMIILSDNTATNLVLDQLGPDLQSRLQSVNDLMRAQGLKNTRILNRVFSWQTKKLTPEAIRYGIGVSTPEDMVLLLEQIHKGTAVDSAACSSMLQILKQQQYNEMIPRYLPARECQRLEVAHKTGDIAETKVDAALVLSERADFALAIFVDKHPDHSDSPDNKATELGARVARAVWDAFAQPANDSLAHVTDVDWTRVPGGSWAIFRSAFAPFPHPQRRDGYHAQNGTYYPYFPHYADSSVVLFVPDSLKPGKNGTRLIVHFHGHGHDNLDILEHAGMPQAILRTHTNAVLVLPQGPYRAGDSFGGKMEEPDGLKNLLNDVMHVLVQEKIAASPAIDSLVLSAHSGGYRAAAFCLDRGGVTGRVEQVFLFDALYAQEELFGKWLTLNHGFLHAAYTPHLGKAHEAFLQSLPPDARARVTAVPAGVEHEAVVPEFFERWLEGLPDGWRW